MEYKDFMIDLAREAGAVIKTNFILGMEKQWKQDETPVTVTDLTINAMVTKAVKKAFPEHGLISEEGSDYSGQEYTWICDPIDGTITFSHGIPLCSFMLALTRNGTPIAAVIYDPLLDRLAFAEKGKGAFLNGKPMSVSTNPSLQRCLVAFFTWPTAKFHLMGVVAPLVDKGVIDLRIPSVGNLDCLLASGQFGAIIFGGTTPWDSAASSLIIEEAGGKVTDIYGKPITDFRDATEGRIATNGLIHDEIVAVVVEHMRLNTQVG